MKNKEIIKVLSMAITDLNNRLKKQEEDNKTIAGAVLGLNDEVKKLKESDEIYSIHGDRLDMIERRCYELEAIIGKPSILTDEELEEYKNLIPKTESKVEPDEDDWTDLFDDVDPEELKALAEANPPHDLVYEYLADAEPIKK